MTFMYPWGLGKSAQSWWKWKTGSNCDFVHVGHSPFPGDNRYPYFHSYFPHVGSRLRYCWLVSSLHKLIIHNLSRLSHLVPSSDVFSKVWLLHISGTSITLQKPTSGLGHLTACVCHLVPHFWPMGGRSTLAGWTRLSQPHTPRNLPSTHTPSQVSSLAAKRSRVKQWEKRSMRCPNYKTFLFKTSCATKGAGKIHFDRMLLQQNSKSKLLRYL